MRKNSSSQAFTFSSVLSGLSDDEISDISLSVATPKDTHNPDSIRQSNERDRRYEKGRKGRQNQEKEPQEQYKKEEESNRFTTPIIDERVYKRLDPEVKEIFDELIPANSKHVFTEPLDSLLQSNISDIFKSKNKSEGEWREADIKYNTKILETLEEFKRNLSQAQENNEGAELLKILIQEDEYPFKKQKKVLKPKVEFDLFLSSSSDEQRQYSFNTGSYVQIPTRLSTPHLTDLTLSIKPLTTQEIQKYRASQRERYLYPERPWIYSTSDKRNAVVGPILTEKHKQSSFISFDEFRAKQTLGWQYLQKNPPFITLPLLVKDALARLPHGMGTLADVVEMLKASSYLDSSEKKLSMLYSIVKVILTELSHRADKTILQNSEADSSVSRHSHFKQVWVYASSGKSIDDWMKAADVEKRKPKTRQKESSRKIKISLEESILKPQKNYSEEPALSKKTKYL